MRRAEAPDRMPVPGECGSPYRRKRFYLEKQEPEASEDGLVDFIATDAHNEKERGPRIGRCADWLEKRLGEAERKRLLTGNPAAVLADREL